MNDKLRLLILWIAPFFLAPLYGFFRFLLHSALPLVIASPSSRTVYSAVILVTLSSPLWVGVGFAFTWLFGGLVVVYVIRGLAENKLFNRRFIISTKDAQKELELEDITSEEEHIPDSSRFAFGHLRRKNFALCLALTLSINLVYTLTLQRYFQDIVSLPQTATQSLYRYLLSPRLIGVEFGLALLFLPLLTIVVPLLFGRISVRQIDAQRFDLYWLSYVYSIAGGASLVLFLVDVFELRQSTEYFVIATLLVYGTLSWYTALGINLGIPYAERRLALELLKLQGSAVTRKEKIKGKEEEEEDDDQRRRRTRNNIIFGHLFAGPTKEDAEQV